MFFIERAHTEYTIYIYYISVEHNHIILYFFCVFALYFLKLKAVQLHNG